MIHQDPEQKRKKYSVLFWDTVWDLAAPAGSNEKNTLTLHCVLSAHCYQDCCRLHTDLLAVRSHQVEATGWNV